jgi:hypothetical protein
MANNQNYVLGNSMQWLASSRWSILTKENILYEWETKLKTCHASNEIFRTKKLIKTHLLKSQNGSTDGKRRLRPIFFVGVKPWFHTGMRIWFLFSWDQRILG